MMKTKRNTNRRKRSTKKDNGLLDNIDAAFKIGVTLVLLAKAIKRDFLR